MKWLHSIFSRNTCRRALFRVDAGRKAGLSFGHGVRCSILAHHLKSEFNTTSLFLMKHYPEGIDYIKNQGWDIQTIDIDANFNKEYKAVVRCVASFKPDWFISDLPYKDQNVAWFKELLRKKIKILFIDDARFVTPDATVILNSSILAENNTRTTSDAIHLFGPDYFIHDSIPSIPNPYIGSDNRQLVISFGGSDPANLTPRVVHALARNNWGHITINVILGPGFQGRKKIKNLIKGSRNEFHIINSPLNIYPFFKHADLVICAGGRTLYELNMLKAPAFAIASIAHEQPVVQAFLQQNLIQAGLFEWDISKFIIEFTRLYHNLLTT